jgi:DNA-binding IclR family transcriptional regulator
MRVGRYKMSKPKSDYSIQTVSNALRLLAAFDSEYELGVSELSRRLGLHKNNVFRLLATLEERGYIEQCARSELYRLGVRCLELGQAYTRGHELLRCSRPILEELSAQVRESSHLAVLRDFQVVHLHGVQPQRLVLTALRTGVRLPAHCTALGKVLLGCTSEEIRQAYDRRVVELDGLRAASDFTIVDRDKFFEHLSTVAVQGFALDIEESEEGLHCVAAPVVDATGRLCAAISISGPSFRLPEEFLFREIVPVVTAAADRLSCAIGAERHGGEVVG